MPWFGSYLDIVCWTICYATIWASDYTPKAGLAGVRNLGVTIDALARMLGGGTHGYYVEGHRRVPGVSLSDRMARALSAM